METLKKNDFVELKYTGYANGSIFDSNVEEDLKKLNPDGKPRETIIVIGQGMLVPGLDRELEGKEIGKEYHIEIKSKDAFGPRKQNLVKTIPLKIFHEKNMDAKPGMVFALDEMLAKVIAVSGARVLTDFNNPLAGKDLTYKIKIVRKLEDEKEKCKCLLEKTFRFLPEFEIKDKIIIRGQKGMEVFVTAFNDKFKELIGKDLTFEEKIEKKEQKNSEEVKRDKK